MLLSRMQRFAVIQCSVFAAHARNGAEERRLFSCGLDQARLFIEAAREGLGTRDDFARANFVWPLALRVWNFEPQNTSTDFVAGQVYEMIWTATTGTLDSKVKSKRRIKCRLASSLPTAIVQCWQEIVD